ncbi:uncharacterized protein EI90DRAFT_3045296 [Cantharellus anzutake]|uniref:uncharacterized protein n=1 Tax=Cantharellus anzutake TaxID=1750568 RepID=UPI00190776D8|nr:uncharacterized protein EI90DRAFT_3045296 [Cantharellus anzutake]KAF8336320.1 hypothetical protein EI90DRAFT_3045296 [Cantharellus anzutake]
MTLAPRGVILQNLLSGRKSNPAGRKSTSQSLITALVHTIFNGISYPHSCVYVGAYQPEEELLPVLQRWLSGPGCLQGSGRLVVVSAFDEEHKDAQERRIELASALSPKADVS